MTLQESLTTTQWRNEGARGGRPPPGAAQRGGAENQRPEKRNFVSQILKEGAK